MRLIASIIGLVLILAACGASAQVEDPVEEQQIIEEAIVVTIIEQEKDCQIEADVSEGEVLFSATEACAPNTIIPFRIVEVDGPQVLHDGGVYAKEEPNPTVWPASHVGNFEIRHRQSGAVLGSITVDGLPAP